MKTKQKEFIPLTNDLLFKETLGNPKNIKYLEDLIESYLGLDKHTLNKKLKVFYESQIKKRNIREKNMRTDLEVIVNNELLINLEMYSIFTDEAYKKSKFYIMKIYSTELKRGEKYKNTKRITQINFIDNVKTKNLKISDDINTTYYYGNKEYDETKQELFRVDIAREMNYNESERFIKWLKYLGAKSKKERLEVIKGDEEFMELEKWIEDYTNGEINYEELSEAEWRDIISFECGQVSKETEIAKNMLNKGFNEKDISEVTGLSFDKINELKE